MSLPDCAAAVLLLAISLYVLLDGFDLGVGALILTSRDERDRDAMVESIAPVWDGNETWLILAGVTLLAAFPLAYASLLPTLYLPIIVMLAALGFRGVAIEFRFQTTRYRKWWDMAFCVGSITAILCQGLVLGIALGGVPHGSAGPSISLSGVSVLTPLAVLSAYAMLGAGWLLWRTEGRLHLLAGRLLRVSLLAFASLASLVLVVLIGSDGPASAAWRSHGLLHCGLGLLAAGAWWSCWTRSDRPNERHALIGGMAIVGLFLIGIAALCWPYVVPFSMTIEQASSPSTSQLFLLTGVALFLPVVLANGAYLYWTFRRRLAPGEAQ